jgi:hypothetical protein
MNVLVDYDNIPRDIKGRGLSYVTDRILNKIGYSVAKGFQRVRFRLYGGWYEHANVTRLAQSLKSEISATFPNRINLIDGANSHSVIGNVELAMSLEIDPSKHLFNTYRRRRLPQGITCSHPTTINCIEPYCPIIPMHDFITNNACPVASCRVKPADFLHKDEQKLVDTMLTADIIHLAKIGVSPICIVTSDDDLWPGIQTAVSSGATVIHIHPIPGLSTPQHYHRLVGQAYSQRAL